jgi:hypothetical protein
MSVFMVICLCANVKEKFIVCKLRLMVEAGSGSGSCDRIGNVH